MAARRPPPRRFKLSGPSEAEIQAAVLRAINYHPAVVWARRMNTGAARTTGRGGTERLVFFGFPGSPDIHGMLRGGRALYIEVKTQTGRLTPEQQKFLALAKHHGAAAGVARSVNDAIAIIEDRV